MNRPAEQWSEVDRYIEELFAPPQDAFAWALETAAAAGLPRIHVSPNEGRLLYLLARLSGARRILEIGLLGGYSALWLTRALPADGRLVSLELEAGHAQVARANLERAGFARQVEIVIGPALASLDRLIREAVPPFDLVFIDADKGAYPEYLTRALRLTRSGSLILADNVIRDGQVAREQSGDAALEAIKRFNRQLAGEPRLEATLLPLWRGSLDGIAIARVR